MRNPFEVLLAKFTRSGDTQRPPTPPSVTGDEQARLVEFKLSGLVQKEWYLQTNQDVAQSGADPFVHFMTYGWVEFRRPNPFFDTAWYVRSYPAVAKANINPLVHYWMYGERQNLQPCPLFDPRWYREKYRTDVGTQNALSHFLRNRHLRRYSPTPLFDVDFYLQSNPDVAAATVEPFFHYTTTGYREGRNPSASFNTQYYLQRFMRGDARDPLTHYAEVGRAANHPTQPAPNTPIHAAEIRKFTSRSAEFEELDPHIANTLRRRAKVIAYYLPQFHAFEENDRWWGKGFTEWTNVARATPRFIGHYQPRIPRDFGFYDLSDPSVMPRQVAAAKAAGLYGFCFYYYNFNGKRLLDAPIESFLERPDIDFPFCLMWANENWTRRWDGAEAEVLMRQDYEHSDAAALVDDIARHFRDRRYIRVKGRPLLFIYRADVIPDTKATLAHWRELFETRHGEHPWILMAQAFDCEDPTIFGFDGAVEFPPHKVTKGCYPFNADCEVFDDNFSARVYRYDDIVTNSISEPAPNFPLIKTIFPGWDNDARRQGQGLTVVQSTPKKYESWLDQTIAYAQAHPFQGEKFVFVNAWNEWAEGTYLEPDVHFGSAYLNATARAITGAATETERRKLLLVGHNAFPAGAQLLLLNLARILKQQFGFTLEILLGGDGDLLEAYKEVAPVSVATTNEGIEANVRRLAAAGFDTAIANSVGSGVLVAYLRHAGIKTVSLVHEMPKLIAENALSGHAERIAEFSDEVVFPSPIVRDAFVSAVMPVRGKTSIRPQGIYHRIARVENARESVIEELGLPSDARIVINVGYGDLRKGIDLFCATARIVAHKHPNVFFLWAGDLHLHLIPWIADEKANPNVRFLGHRKDVGRLLSAADAFALTSREDPFPSVVLEALSIGVPVAGFDQAGGFADVISDATFGRLVPLGDVVGLADSIVELLSSAEDRSRAIQNRKIGDQFVFDDYTFSLVERLDPSVKRVSVVVPNYNYARYLPERLQSIFNQTYPVFEIIFLDDNSTDESLKVFGDVCAAAQRSAKVIRNDKNSGNVFAQWAKGASLARGELIWIAEADDLSDPTFLERMVGYFEDNQVSLAFSDSKAIDADSNDMEISYKAYYSKIRSGALSHDLIEPGREFATAYLSQRNAILNVSSTLWRRDTLSGALASSKSKLSSLKLAGDWRLYLAACAEGGKIAYCSSQLNLHRRHAGGVTSKTTAQRQLKEIREVHEFFNRAFESDASIFAQQAEYLRELSAQFGQEEVA